MPAALRLRPVFIELTDILRCPEDHEEAYLVLLPDRMEGRSVVSGQLGCPVCGRGFAIADGVLDLGDAPPPGEEGTALDADAVEALAGLRGAGGYFVLVGPVAGLWEGVRERVPGVALVAVNPGPSVANAAGVSVLRGGRIPLKASSVRGVVLGRPFADAGDWVREAARVVLPGLRVVGEGADPPADVVEVMAHTPGVWVGTKRR